MEVHVSLLELGLGEHADAARAGVVVALEGEVHLGHTVALRGCAERGLGAVRGAAEQDALLGLHGDSFGSRMMHVRPPGGQLLVLG